MLGNGNNDPNRVATNKTGASPNATLRAVTPDPLRFAGSAQRRTPNRLTLVSAERAHPQAASRIPERMAQGKWVPPPSPWRAYKIVIRGCPKICSAPSRKQHAHAKSHFALRRNRCRSPLGDSISTREYGNLGAQTCFGGLPVSSHRPLVMQRPQIWTTLHHRGSSLPEDATPGV